MNDRAIPATEAVSIPLDVAQLVVAVWLPINPNKMRMPGPGVVEAAHAFKNAVARVEQHIALKRDCPYCQQGKPCTFHPPLHSSPADGRAAFEKWLSDVQGLDAKWDQQRNCYEEFPAHLAWCAWKEARSHEPGMKQALRDAINRELPRTHKGFRCQYEQDAVMRALDRAFASIRQPGDDGPGEEDGPWAEGWEKRSSTTKGENHAG